MKNKFLLIRMKERLYDCSKDDISEYTFDDLIEFVKRNIDIASYEKIDTKENHKIRTEWCVEIPHAFRFSHFLESEAYSLRISKRIYKHRLRKEKRSTIFRPENPNQSLIYGKAFDQIKEIVMFYNVNRFLISPIHIQQ